MLKQKELILFDLDGTLVDSVPDLALALNDMLESLGRKTFDESVIRSWVGNGAQTLVTRGLCGSLDIDSFSEHDIFTKALDTFLKSYAKNLCVKTILYPSVLHTLQTLQANGFRLALVTNKPYDFIEPLLIGLGIDNMFEMCLGGDSLSKKKPDPMPLLNICENLHVEISKAVMIGDSKNDIIAANAAKMQSIGVTYGYNYGEDISVYNPDAVIDDFSEILSLLSDKD